VSTSHDQARAATTLFRNPRLADLHRWSRATVSAQEFERCFLEPLRTLLQADCIAVWFDPGGETLYLRHNRAFNTQELQCDLSNWQRHGRLLRSVADVGQPRCIAPGFEDGDSANPTGQQLLITGTVVVGTQRVILEAFRSTVPEPHLDPTADLELLAAAAECAADYVRAERIVEERRAYVSGRLQQEFVRQLHASLDPQRVAFIAANEGARILGCDRVTVLRATRNTARVAAVSGQAEPNSRANSIRLMESFATRLSEEKQTVVCTAAAKRCPAGLEGSLQAFTAASGCTALIAVPLPAADTAQAPLGVLLVEQFTADRAGESLVEGAQLVAQHVAAALQNATAHDRILFRAWRGRAGRMLAESRRLQRVLALLALVAVVVTLCVVQLPLRMPAKGKLRAAQRQAAFAAESGTIRTVSVRHGDRVTAGQPLVSMENHDLSAQLQRAAEQLASVTEQLKIRETERADRQLSTLRHIQLDGEIAEFTERESFLQQQQALLQQRMAQLMVAAPIDGVVVTWNPQQQLADRPAAAGQLLIEVINPDGPWQIEFQVPDVDAGYVRRAWAERSPDDRKLPVDYILATHPDRQFHGWLVELATRTENSGAEPVVFVTVEPDPADLPPLQDGAEVRGKILCGTRAAGFVLLRDVIEFVQSRILF